MPKDGKIMSSLEMRSLILDALAEEDKEKTPWKQTFQMYRYRGSILALRSIVEFRAIERGLIDKVVNIPLHAWGVPGGIPYYGGDTNFIEDEIDLFSEEVRLLMFQNVISPGAAGSYGDDWPYFHVTKYGLECRNSSQGRRGSYPEGSRTGNQSPCRGTAHLELQHH